MAEKTSGIASHTAVISYVTQVHVTNVVLLSDAPMSIPLARAEQLYRMRRYEEAFRAAQAHLAESPRDPVAHVLMAHCLIDAGKGEAAMAVAKQAVACGPAYPPSHAALSRAYLACGDARRAERALGEALRLDPVDADHYHVLAWIHEAQGKPQAAFETASQGLSFDPQHVGCADVRARAAIRLGRMEEASQTVGIALAARPDDPAAHENLGYVRLHEGRPGDAFVAFREALRLDPGSERARSGMLEALRMKHSRYAVAFRISRWLKPNRATSVVLQIVWILGMLITVRMLQGKSESTQLAAACAVMVVSLVVFHRDLLINGIDLVLQFDDEGRRALTWGERWLARLAAASAVTGSVLLVAAVVWHRPLILPAFSLVVLHPCAIRCAYESFRGVRSDVPTLSILALAFTIASLAGLAYRRGTFIDETTGGILVATSAAVLGGLTAIEYRERTGMPF